MQDVEGPYAELMVFDLAKVESTEVWDTAVVARCKFSVDDGCLDGKRGDRSRDRGEARREVVSSSQVTKHDQTLRDLHGCCRS